MNRKLKILLLEDNASDVKLLKRALSRSFDAFTLKVIERKEEYLAELLQDYDIVISDFALPAFDGMEALKIKNKERPFMPFIITTGSTNEDTAVQCMKEGADDYIIKEHITRIGEAVKRAIALKKAEYDRQKAFETVQHLNRTLKAIRNINQLITREHDVQKLIQQACEMFTQEQSYRAAWIALFDEKGNLGKVNAYSGFSAKAFSPLAKGMLRGEWPACLKMASEEKGMVHILLSDTSKKDCPFARLKLSSSAFCEMLEYNNKKLGFITVSIPDDVEVNHEEKELFRQVASDLAYALFNLEVEKENRENALRQQVLYQIAHAAVLEGDLTSFLVKVYDIIKQVVDFDHAYIALYDEEHHQYTFPFKKGILSGFHMDALPDSRKGLIYYVRKKQKLIRVNNDQIRELVKKGEVEIIGPLSTSWMGVPLTHKNRFIGVLVLIHQTNLQAFSEKDEELMRFISNQLALFIERKEALKALRVSNKRYKTLMQQASDSILLCDMEGKIVEVNEKIEKSLGYASQEILSMNAFDLLPPSLAEIQKKKYWDYFSPGKIIKFETIFRRKDHSEFPVEISAGVVHIGDKDLVLAIARDISERKRTEERIQLLSLGVEQSPASIVITDKEGNIQYVNKKFTEVSGYSLDEVLGKNLRILKSGKMPDRIYTELWNTITAGEEWRGEMINRKKDQSLFWELVSISPVKNNDGEITHFIAVKEDITSRKEMEAELRKAKQKAEESNRLKSEFLANMSHEIRTPMNGIIGFASLLEDEDLTAESRKNYVQIIQNSTRQLLHIIDEILEVSRLQTRQVEKSSAEVNINELLMSCFSEFDRVAKEKSLSIYLKKGLPDEVALVYIDGGKLHKVIHHLVENALKFTQEGYIELGYRLKGKDRLEFFVKDTGIGIGSNAREMIFDEFSQEDKRLSRLSGGLGLGLSIVKGYVDLLGGTIRIESEKGKGSVFYVEIPYVPVHPEKLNLLPEPSSDTAAVTVLVAEDEEVNYQYLEILLRKFNPDIVVQHAVTGEDAVKACRDNPDISLVLMDLKMPGMNGLEATRKIKAQNPNIIIVAQTAYTAPENQQEAKKAGCDSFLRKPTRKANLFKVLNKYLTTRKR
ncbi:PAS domain S-box protein [Candidatus Sulfidibacterium hydrothermale]|uniref:PAS domain S-box protein n=1 Tax=Candidatus Sulfidibacterium hydrothermale TaxID=2875962 RepID=UPI001F0A4121|nr:PAS domain S-box protein [Candidatus Sulfidibacterium hydrothermale]UBM61920.1 PAS domain S-box protein [Candidatus Sulfidibacterium hydrothermale]